MMKKVSNIIIDTQPRLAKLINQKNIIDIIKTELNKIDLFNNNSDYYRFIKFSQGLIYLSTTSSALATQIRHSSSIILNHLRQAISNIEFHAIQCQIHLSSFSPCKQASLYKKNQPKAINPVSKKALINLSKHINESNLKEALERLAMSSKIQDKK